MKLIELLLFVLFVEGATEVAVRYREVHMNTELSCHAPTGNKKWFFYTEPDATEFQPITSANGSHYEINENIAGLRIIDTIESDEGYYLVQGDGGVSCKFQLKVYGLFSYNSGTKVSNTGNYEQTLVGVQGYALTVACDYNITEVSRAEDTFVPVDAVVDNDNVMLCEEDTYPYCMSCEACFPLLNNELRQFVVFPNRRSASSMLRCKVNLGTNYNGKTVYKQITVITREVLSETVVLPYNTSYQLCSNAPGDRNGVISTMIFSGGLPTNQIEYSANNLPVLVLENDIEVSCQNLDYMGFPLAEQIYKYSITLTEPAQPVISEPSQNIPIIIRTIFELENYSLIQQCKSSGNPEPEIKWTSNTNITSKRDLILQLGDVSIDGEVNPYIFTCTASNSEGEDKRSIRIRIDIDLMDETEKLENVTVEIVRKFSKIIAKNIQGVDVTYEAPSVSREVVDRNADNFVNLVIKYNESDISGEEKKAAIEGMLQPAGDIIQKNSELIYEDDRETRVEEGDIATASKGLTSTLYSLEVLGSNLLIDIPTNITTSVSISSPIVTLVAENYFLPAGNNSNHITIPDSSTIKDKDIEERIHIPVQVARLLSSHNKNNFRVGTSIVRNTLKPKQKDSVENTTHLVSNIITVVISGYENRIQMISLPEPVRLIFSVTSVNVSNKQTCSFLNSSLWSTNGLTTDAAEDNLTYCYTDHFTSFAVFVTPRQLPNDEFSRIASLVSYVLVSISLVALVVSLILFLISGKYFFKVEANIVYFNYCLAMTIAFGLFLFGIESGKFHIIACMTIAFLLHYIWLAVFIWTLCNGILIMYKLTIGILRERKIYPYLICFGWTSPFIIPIITIAIKHNNYVKPEAHCFITYEDGLIWSFIGPILIILAINMLILVFASIRIATARFGTDKMDEKQALKKGIISSLILTPLLGIPWLILLVNVFIAYPIVQWVFIIINGLMGVFFFFAITLRNAEVKKLCTKSSKIVQQPSTYLTVGKASGMLSNRFKKSISKDAGQVPPTEDANREGEYIALDVSSPTSPTDKGVVMHKSVSKPKLLPKPKNLLKSKYYSKDLPEAGVYPYDIPEDVKPIDPSNIYDFLQPKTELGVYIELDVENDMPEFGNKPQSESTKVSDKKLYQNLDSIS